MTNFVVLDFLDVWPLSASLHGRQHLFGDLGSIIVQNEDGEQHPELEKWKNLRNVLSRIARLDAQREYELKAARIDLMKAGETRDWAIRFNANLGLEVLHLPIVTNPRTLMYSGMEMMHIPPGVLTWVNVRALCSEVNFGPTPRIHLVLEVRKKANGRLDPDNGGIPSP